MEKKRRRGGDLGLLIKTPAEIGHCLDNKKRGTFLSLSRSIYIYISLFLCLCERWLCSECLRLNQHVRSSELSPRRGWTEDRERRRIKRTLPLSLFPFRSTIYYLSRRAQKRRAQINSEGMHARFRFAYTQVPSLIG